MYIGVMHTITNKANWAQGLKDFAAGTLPDGFTNPMTLIGSQADYAFCLWDAPSIEALRPMLDGATEGAATNMYFPIDANAFGTNGIPAQRIDLDTKAHSKA
jgi:hypothetical protein